MICENRETLQVMFKSFGARLSGYYRLNDTYKAISSLIVLVGSIVGFVIWGYFALAFRTFLGIPLGGVPLDGIEIQAFTWVLGILFSLPIIILPCIVITSFVLGGGFWITGKITTRELWRLSLLGEYPKQWYVK